MGTATRRSMRACVPSERSQIWRNGFEKSDSGRSPRPGLIEVQPKSASGFMSRISIASASPGSAPRTRTGPVSGWPRKGPRLSTSAWVDTRE